MTLPLCNLPTGKSGKIQELQGDRVFAARAAALGFTVGAEVTMIQNHGQGPILVGVRHTRLALSRSDALNIQVLVP